MSNKPRSLKELFANNNSKDQDRNCKTENSLKENNSANTKTVVKKKLMTMNQYMKDIKDKYLIKFKKARESKEKKDFKQAKESKEKFKKRNEFKEDNFTILNEFEKKMPIISGKNKNFSDYINIPDKQYFMNHLFKQIIKIFGK